MAVEVAAPAGRPPAPDGLGPDGLAAWAIYWASPVAGALASVDHAVLARLCRVYDALEALHPVYDVKDWTALEKVAGRLETSLGITPAARARLGIKLAEAKRATLDLDS